MKFRKIITAAFAAMLALATVISGEPRFAPDRVIVKLANTPATRSMLAKSAASASGMPDLGIGYSGMRLLNPSEDNAAARSIAKMAAGDDTHNNVYVLTLEETGEDAVERALAALNANPAVEIAEPDFYLKRRGAARSPNDPQIDEQWALEAINAAQAWEITTGSKSVVVGIVDTGLEGDHPDLVDNLWVNPNAGQRGYANDVHGYQFVERVGGIPFDIDGHGTHVAGIVGARGNNGRGVAGINWEVSLAWLGAEIGELGLLSNSSIIEATYYAHNNNIPITNNSYGGPYFSQIEKEAICNYSGLFVAASGNESVDNDVTPSYPNDYDCPNIISVSAIDSEDKLSSFSNYGAKNVDIAAPGSAILSTIPGGEYIVWGGTSMAAPYVAGVAALIKSIRPDYTTTQLRDVLIATARQTDALDGFGILDAYAALLYGVEDLIPVTYDYNDGERGSAIIKTAPGRKPVPPGRPFRDDYNFAGWFTSPTGRVPFSGVVTAPITLYARWTPKAPEVDPGPGSYALEFPDANFRSEVIHLLNALDNGHRTGASVIMEADKAALASMTELDVSGKNIYDMTGLQYFTGLIFLNCNENDITALDVSGSTALEELYSRDNKLTTLNLSGLAALKIMSCRNNKLAALDLSGLSSLEELYVSNNLLTELDVTGFQLTTLWVHENDLPDESAVIGFTGVWDGENFIFSPQGRKQYHAGDLQTVCAVLGYVGKYSYMCDTEALSDVHYITWNDESPSRIIALYLEDSELSGSISLSGLSALEVLYINDNYITALGLSGLSSLKYLNAAGNNLMELDLSGLTALERLVCADNALTALDLSANIELAWLQTAHNSLAALNVSNNPKLEFIDCSYNDLASQSAVAGFAGVWDGVNFIFSPQRGEVISVAERDRVIPQVNPDNSAVVITPANVTAFELTVGPNPVRGSDGVVNIFLSGKRVNDGTLSVYDRSGNVINKIHIRDDIRALRASPLQSGNRRIVGEWDLKDDKGAPVSAGSYLVRGTLRVDGKREPVSVIIGVR